MGFFSYNDKEVFQFSNGEWHDSNEESTSSDWKLFHLFVLESRLDCLLLLVIY